MFYALAYLPVDVGGHSTTFLKLSYYHTRTEEIKNIVKFG